MKADSVTKSTFASGVVLALFGAAAIFWIIPTYVIGANSDRGGLTPGFMPRVAAWCMIVIGCVVALNALRVILGQITAIAEESEENERLVFGRNEVVDSIIIMLVSAVYVLGLTKLGFLIPSAIIIGAVMYCTGYRKIIPLVVISIGFPALLEFLLWNVLNVPLPEFPLINF